MKTKINLGCGEDYLSDYINVDISESPDINHNLNVFPYPFEDNSFDEILISHVLEHLDDVHKVLDEVYRISKSNVKITIHAPHWSHPMSYADPTHKRVFSSYSDIHFDEYKFMVMDKYYTFVRTKFALIDHMVSPLLNISHHFTELIFSKFLPISQITFELEVLK